MEPSSQKVRLQTALNASFAMLPPLPPCDDVRCLQTAVCSVAFVAKVDQRAVRVVHLHIADQIWAHAQMYLIS